MANPDNLSRLFRGFAIGLALYGVLGIALALWRQRDPWDTAPIFIIAGMCWLFSWAYRPRVTDKQRGIFINPGGRGGWRYLTDEERRESERLLGKQGRDLDS